LHRRIFEGVDRCEGASSGCLDYLCDWGLSEFAFARVVANLAEFVVRYRARLPRVVVWLETVPQHFPGAGLYTGKPGKQCEPHKNSSVAAMANWRNEVANTFLDLMWPDAGRSDGPFRVHIHDIMQPRYDDHKGWSKRAMALDCTHFCVHSAAQAEATASLMTAIVQRLNKDHGSSGGSVSMDDSSVCARAALAVDRFSASGLLYMAALGLALLTPLVCASCGICICLRVWRRSR